MVFECRSDYLLTERWSYGADVTYESRCDAAHDRSDDKRPPHKRPHSSSLHRKRQKTTSLSSAPDDCIAHCTRSRTALKSSESVSETPKHLKTPSSAAQPHQGTHHANQAETGLLPLDDRDYAYSPFSSSTVTELVDSDNSVYSPTTHRTKGKKRKRSTHRSLSSRKSHTFLNLDVGGKKLKIDQHKEPAEATNEAGADCKPAKHDSEHRAEASVVIAPQASCTYPLRSRHNRDLGRPTSTVTREDSGKYTHNPAAAYCIQSS